MTSSMGYLPSRPPVYDTSAELPTDASSGSIAVVLTPSLSLYGFDGTTWNLLTSGSTTTVTSVTGTANQVIASPTTGDVILSTPQSIATTSNVQFASIKLTTGATNGYVLTSDAAGAATWVANAAVASAITTLTGDVTASGPGSAVATIANNAVTYAKFQQVAATTLVGNATGGTANVGAITLGASLAFTASVLNTIQAITTSSSPVFAAIKLTTGATNGYILTSDAAGNATWAANSGGGVTSLTATTNQTTVSAATGAVIVGTVQNIGTGSSPAFAGLNLSSLTVSQAVVTDGSKNLISLAYTNLPTVSTLVSRDANGNARAVNFGSSATAVTSAAGTTVLTAASSKYQILQGSTTQTFQLPDATTLYVGNVYEFYNDSTGLLTINNNAASLVATVSAGARAFLICTSIGTTNGTWSIEYGLPSNAVYGTAGLVITGTFQSTGAAQVSTLGVGSSIATSAILSLSSTTLGFLPPVMTTTQKNSISSPATGLVVYDSSLANLQFYNGSSWIGAITTGVTSVTGTTNRVTVSASTGAVNISGPQDIATFSAVQFGSLGLGAALTTSAILSLTSTTLGFLPPVLTTTQKNAISSTATGLVVYDSTLGALQFYNGSAWIGNSSAGVTSLTATANQTTVSASTGAVTIGTVQSIGTSSAVQFGSLGIGSSLATSAILSLSSTTLGFLPPVMNTSQKNAIGTPATGLVVYDSSLSDLQFYNGSSWIGSSISGVTGIIGTAIQVLANGTSGSTQTGNVTLTLPQNIGTTSQVQFGLLGLGVSTSFFTDVLNISAPHINGFSGHALFDANTLKWSIRCFFSDYSYRIGDTGAYQFTLLQGGNAGFGTTTPQNRLDVNGGLAIGSYAGVNTATSNGLIVSGNVGIGTTSPGSQLVVSNFSAPTSSYSIANVAGSLAPAPTGFAVYSGLVINPTWGTTSDTHNAYYSGILLSPTFAFAVGAPTAGIVTGAYVNVVISSSNAAAISFITGIFVEAGSFSASTGVITSAYGIYISNPATGPTNRIALYTDNGSIGYTAVTPPTNGLIVSGFASFGTSTSITNLAVQGSSSDFDNVGSIHLRTAVPGTGGSPRLCFGIKNSTNAMTYAWIQAIESGINVRPLVLQNSGGPGVGIGQVIPLSMLDVNGNVSIGAGFAGVSTAPTNGAIIQGTVGIGTPTPALGQLHIVGPSVTSQIRLGDDTNPGFIFNNSGVPGLFISSARDGTAGTFPNTGIANASIQLSSNNANSYITFSTTLTNNTAATERMRILASGQVGVGVTAPGTNFFQIAPITSTLFAVGLALTGTLTGTTSIHFAHDICGINILQVLKPTGTANLAIGQNISMGYDASLAAATTLGGTYGLYIDGGSLLGGLVIDAVTARFIAPSFGSSSNICLATDNLNIGYLGVSPAAAGALIQGQVSIGSSTKTTAKLLLNGDSSLPVIGSFSGSWSPASTTPAAIDISPVVRTPAGGTSFAFLNINPQFNSANNLAFAAGLWIHNASEIGTPAKVQTYYNAFIDGPASSAITNLYTYALGLGGSLQLRTTTTAVDYFYAALENFIFVNAPSNSRTIFLPIVLPENGIFVIIKDIGGAAATHNIVIDPQGNHIDGSAGSIAISQNYGTVSLMCDGTTGWWLFSP